MIFVLRAGFRATRAMVASTGEPYPGSIWSTLWRVGLYEAARAVQVGFCQSYGNFFVSAIFLSGTRDWNFEMQEIERNFCFETKKV